MGYFEKEGSAPANLVLPKPVAIPRREMLGKILIVGAGGGMVLGLEGCPTASQWFDIALTDLPTILQVVTGIVAIASNPVVALQLETEITRIANEVTKDLNTAKTLIAGYNANPNKGTALGDIEAALQDAQTNLSALLEAFHVSDPALQATISAAVGLAITAVLAVQALVPPPPTATTARLSLSKQNGSNAIKEAYNIIVGKHYPTAVLPVSA